MKIILFIGTVLLTTACVINKNSTPSTTAVPSEPTQMDVDRVQTKFPGYTLNELMDGKQLFESNCNLCHGLKKLTSESEEEWRKIVPPMVKKANKKNGNLLDAVAEDKILKYVITMGPATAQAGH